MKKTVLMVLLLLAACATQSAMPLGNGLMQIDVSAAPVYGRAGAQEMALKKAAQATIDAGYDKFIVVKNQGWNENSISGGSYGSANVNAYGGMASEGSYFGSERHPEVNMTIRMFHYKDKGSNGAIDARKIVAKNANNFLPM